MGFQLVQTLVTLNDTEQRIATVDASSAVAELLAKCRQR